MSSTAICVKYDTLVMLVQPKEREREIEKEKRRSFGVARATSSISIVVVTDIVFLSFRKTAYAFHRDVYTRLVDRTRSSLSENTNLAALKGHYA